MSLNVTTRLSGCGNSSFRYCDAMSDVMSPHDSIVNCQTFSTLVGLSLRDDVFVLRVSVLVVSGAAVFDSA